MSSIIVDDFERYDIEYRMILYILQYKFRVRMMISWKMLYTNPTYDPSTVVMVRFNVGWCFTGNAGVEYYTLGPQELHTKYFINGGGKLF